jgi:hypothetical protein
MEADPTPAKLCVRKPEALGDAQNFSHDQDNISSSELFKFETNGELKQVLYGVEIHSC